MWRMLWLWVGGKLRPGMARSASPNSEGTDEMEKNVMLRPAIVSRAMQKLKDAMTPRDIPEDHVFDADWLGQRAKANEDRRHLDHHVSEVATNLGSIKMHPMPSGEWYGVKKFTCGHVVEVTVKIKEKPVAIISMDII